jgi:Rps23 Pro-64 3,4-dihydroxylase Tpa1-like proline 4-hydroxylase
MIIKTTSTDYGYFDPSISALGAQYRDQYNSATPFPHIVLHDFLDQEILERCLRDFPSTPKSVVGYRRSQENLKFEFKPETLLPQARSLFYSFNSIPFVGFIENLTGIKGLIPDPYFAGAGFHQVNEGGHLDIHTDFNFHSAMGLERRINVLIYLNKDWKEEYGGCFEIWDQKMSRCCRRVVPDFNTCVVFNTSSTSFHGNPVQVKHPHGQPRRAIALYYYTATWDRTRRANNTSFKVRPDSADQFDLRLRLNEVVEDVVPPVALRGLRKLARVAARTSKFRWGVPGERGRSS